MATIEIFRAGKHKDQSGATTNFSVADLEKTAAAYDPAKHESPGVVGHPTNNAPAYCWAKKLFVEGDTLKAEVDQVDPAFAEMVNAGRFKKISASFYKPDSADNPNPGVYSLRHIGFLGAQPPAVKGLKSASFSDVGDGVLEFGSQSMIVGLFWSMRDFMISQFGLDAADKALPKTLLTMTEDEARAADASEEQEAIDEATEQQMGYSEAERTRLAEIEAREQALAAKEAKIKADEEAAQTAAAAHARRLAFGEFLDPLVKDGKVLPVDADGWVEVLDLLSPAAALNFGEAGEIAPIDWVKSRLVALPVVVEYREVAADDLDFAEGMKKSSKEMTKKIQEYVEAQKQKGMACSYTEAFKAVTGRNPKGEM